ncbi:hypothetical protein JHK87_017772 [Glycine soja]|nr:hypothetical protein JHK87_017772 [Glycine soja]
MIFVVTRSSDEEQQNLAASASQHDNSGASNQDPLAESSASHVPDVGKEEEMVEAAMEDSKTDTAVASSSQQMDILQDSSDHELPQSHSQQDYQYDLERAILLSLKDLDDPASPVAEEANMLSSLSEAEKIELTRKILRECRERAQAITIAVHMPDGRLIYRHFIKTDKLEDLFEFVDIAGFQEILSGTYRLVQHFPRRAYGIEDFSSTFDEVGLSNNETLYVEKISAPRKL